MKCGQYSGSNSLFNLEFSTSGRRSYWLLLGCLPLPFHTQIRYPKRNILSHCLFRGTFFATPSSVEHSYPLPLPVLYCNPPVTLVWKLWIANDTLKFTLTFAISHSYRTSSAERSSKRCLFRLSPLLLLHWTSPHWRGSLEGHVVAVSEKMEIN